MGADDVQRLSDASAIAALSDVSRQWLMSRTLEATDSVFAAAARQGALFPSLPSWTLDPSTSQSEAGAAARKALAAMISGGDDEVAGWARVAVKRTQAFTVHVIDPITLGIAGVILIGSILAARVKKIGDVEFYEGVPGELVNVVKEGAKAAGALG